MKKRNQEVTYFFTDACVYIGRTFVDNVTFSVRAGVFSEIWTGQVPEEIKRKAISLKGYRVVPGFIDQHVHGSIGYDFMDGVAEHNQLIAKYMPRLGVTSFLATTLTASSDDIRHALENLKSLYRDDSFEGAQVLGVHLEGPYINPEKKGAHEVSMIVKPNVWHYQNLTLDYEDMIKMVTLAPELDRGYDLIRYLNKKRVCVSVGHSQASYTDVKKAHQMGLKCVTHCYNAMNSITSRDGGVLGAALTIKSLSAELIADGIHVSEENIRLFDIAKSENKKILVSDAMRARGLQEGPVLLGGLKAYYDGDKVTLSDGTLAGSVLTQLDALAHYVKTTEKSLESILPMLTRNPATLLGVFDRKGSIDIGKDADFLILDESTRLRATFCRGKMCYRGEFDENC